ncbi:type III-A CRISPR-associated RAMP protein Csm3 [Desulfonatronovibrio magnus]|uniref:type III-A CRISPR-associated RAMP protein Csm3 n=1 Tax=Desulfonatronovibrio magnus TaxID=698827 RepID=UPI0005EB1CCF|nr:type III-A CRISPR-associated RAMP protein Csm3 [Desulfonatronovibrio magnus]
MTEQNLIFKSRIFIKGTIFTLTGLHIGGNSTEMGIGGADSIVIRDPMTNRPLIPGSSLRGKMRSLSEKCRHEFELVSDNGKFKGNPGKNPANITTKLFGVSAGEREANIPQRLIVRDAALANPEDLENAKNTDMPMTEVKTEVAIDRVTSRANPRQIERVPAGARFSFELILNLYGDDDQGEYLPLVFECMQLLQDDYLGGHGARGYGRVKFSIEELSNKNAEDYQNNSPARKMDFDIPDSLKA